MGKRAWYKIILFAMLVVLMGVGVPSKGEDTVLTGRATVEAAARKNGWSKTGKTWYYYKNGRKVKNDWVYYKKSWYFMKPGRGAMASGQMITWKSQKYYIKKSGKMALGWKKIKGKWYYFSKPKGNMRTGWIKVGGKRYYLYKGKARKGIMATGTVKIGKWNYTFDSSGAYKSKKKAASKAPNKKTPGLQKATGTKTIRNYLIHSLRPVGTTTYLLGAGAGTEAGAPSVPKKMDCSWFVRWTTNQTMKKNYEWVKSTNTAATYKKWGLGTYYSHKKLKKDNFMGKFKAGDLVNRTGHVWIVIGQCPDGSYVLVHTSPPCTQIAGTPRPSDGSGASQAIALAQQYMMKYYQSTLDKHNIPGLNTWCTDLYGYMTDPTVTSFRWSSKVLSDPEGYHKMPADKILADLYGEL